MTKELYIQLNTPLFIELNHALNAWLPQVFWRVATLLGDGFVGIAIALLLASYGRSRFFRDVIIGTLLCSAIVRSLKPLLAVSRPPGALDLASFFHYGAELTIESFPSGHTATAFLLAGMLASLRPGNKGFAAVLFSLALLGGLSRIALGVHWPGDVLVGAFVGWVSAWGAVQLGRCMEKRSGSEKKRNMWFYIVLALFCIVSLYHLIFFQPAPGEIMPEIAIRRTLAGLGLLVAAYEVKKIFSAWQKTRG